MKKKTATNDNAKKATQGSGDKIPSIHAATPNALARSPDRWVSCYVAGKNRHAPMLSAIRKDWPTIRFAARWPLIASMPSEANRPARHWQDDNLADMMTSEVMVVYAEPGDHLSNAIFEAGIAWQMGKRIWLVSPGMFERDDETVEGDEGRIVDHPDFKNLRGRPRVRLVRSLAAALTEIATLADYPSRGA